MITKKHINTNVIHVAKVLYMENGSWKERIDRREVALLCMTDRYAMVRRPGCTPYVCEIKNLETKK